MKKGKNVKKKKNNNVKKIENNNIVQEKSKNNIDENDENSKFLKITDITYTSNNNIKNFKEHSSNDVKNINTTNSENTDMQSTIRFDTKSSMDETRVFKIVKKSTKNDEKKSTDFVLLDNSPKNFNASDSVSKPEKTAKKESPKLEDLPNMEVGIYDDVTNQKNKKKRLVIILAIVFIVIILILVLTFFGIVNANSNKIVKGVSVNNIDISSITKEDAIALLNEKLNNNDVNIITVKRGDYSKDIHLSDIGGSFTVNEGVDIAYNIGRDGNIISNNFKTIETLSNGKNIYLKLNYDEELLKNTITQVNLELPDIAIDSSYVIENNKIIIKNSKDGVQVNSSDFATCIINAFASTEKSFDIPVEKADSRKVDIDSIHDEIYKAPVNAYYTKNPRKVYKEEYGLDFAISIAEAKKLAEENSTEFEIPLKVLKPSVTVASLDASAYPDLLSTFTTSYGLGDANRNTNIDLAAKGINGVIVMPGETFSYNKLIGECSERTGYKAATIYLNGKLSTGVGGGICQVSTTMYNTVLRANLEIVERRNHSLGVTYVPAGQDAMVSIGSSDFKFKNNRDYPVKVVAFTNSGKITCQIYGLKKDNEYEVKLESRTLQKTDKFYKVETYKVLYLNGAEVSRTWLSTDTYKYHQ